MKVLNFGSLNIDYVYQVEDFVRAGQTISSSALNLYCGGKGLNQSVAFSRAGAKTYHAGIIGAEGQMLVDMLASSGVDVTFVRRTGDIPTGHAIIQVNRNGENCIMLYGGANETVSESFAAEVLSNFGAGDLLMLQNEINNLDFIIRTAKKRQMKIALNPSPFNEKITALDLSLIDYIILNETEGMEITGKSAPDDIIETLLVRFPDLKITLTLGSRGSRYADKATRAEQGIFKTKVVDTTAAGDTFTGYFYFSILSGKSPEESLKIASKASSVTVSRQGAAPSIPTADEL